jgi:hypothetical protein
MLISALLTGCATIPPKTSETMNYAYITEKPQPGNPTNSLAIFKTSYSIGVVAIDNVIIPNKPNAQTFLVSPGKHAITVACSVVTVSDVVLDDGYTQPYIRTLDFTAAPNGNYAVAFDFPSKSASKAYDNACNYAVIQPIASVRN